MSHDIEMDLPEFPDNDGSSRVSAPAVSPAAPLQKDETLFIFDWDDTILPTTWLALNEMRVDMPGNVPDHIKQQLENYAPWAIRTLEEAEKYGKVLIVTNAEEGWIELTVKRFFPSWEPVIGRIPFVSARSTWEPTGCVMPVEWKVRSFNHEIEKFFGEREAAMDGRGVLKSESAETAGGGSAGTSSSETTVIRRRNIIGLGDSTSDREAMLHVTQAMSRTNEGSNRETLPMPPIQQKPNVVTIGKSLKFMERPNLEHLQKQHHLICASMKEIALHDRALDLCIQHQPGQVPATGAPVPTAGSAPQQPAPGV